MIWLLDLRSEAELRSAGDGAGGSEHALERNEVLAARRVVVPAIAEGQAAHGLGDHRGRQVFAGGLGLEAWGFRLEA